MAVNVSITRKRIANNYNSIKSTFISGSNAAVVHREFATAYGVTDIVDRVIEVTFVQEFKVRPNGWFKVYRLNSRSGKYFPANVLHWHNVEDWLTTTGFSLEIDPNEPLAGVIFEYYYTE